MYSLASVFCYIEAMKSSLRKCEMKSVEVFPPFCLQKFPFHHPMAADNHPKVLVSQVCHY